MRWKSNNLTEISQVQTGKWDANHANESGKYKFFTCAYDSFFCDTKRFTGECLILPGNGANVGEVFYYSGIFDAYQRTYVVSEIQLEPKFLFYHMKYFWRDRNLNKQFGSATNYLKIVNFKDYEVSYPSQLEQKRIVTILDQAFADIEQARAKTEQNLKNARELFESQKAALFEKLSSPSDLMPLPQVCEEIFAGGDAPKKGLFSKNINEKYDIPIYANAVKDNGLYGFTNYSRVTKPSITIAARGSGTGHIELREGAYLPIVRLIVLIPNQEVVDQKYLKHALQTLDILRSGSAIPQLTVPMIKGYSIPVPSLGVQGSVVNELEVLDTEVTQAEGIYISKIGLLEELKKSILQKAFSGELTKGDALQ